MRSKAGAFSRYRPRVLTLILLFVVAVPTVLANLSFEIVPVDLKDSSWGTYHGSYGWPLIWNWHILTSTPLGAGVTGWDYSPSRLAGNLAIWLAMLVTAGGTCEWLVRRYQPRLRWNLRTMLAAVGLLGVCCAWCVMLRNRANQQEPIIAEIKADRGQVWVERWGPKWLDLVGADRFRRRIIGAEWGGSDREELLQRLGRLPALRYLDSEVYGLTPGIVAALGDMRQLQKLSIRDVGYEVPDDEEGISHGFLAAIGNMTGLEELRLEGTKIASGSLGCLAGLTNLKSLSLEFINCLIDERESEGPERNHTPSLLAHLPALPVLETIDLSYSSVGDQDLRHLAVLPRLKSLNLTQASVTDAGLANLAFLESLEELAIDDSMASAVGLESLLALKRLKALHICPSYGRSGRKVTLALDHGNRLVVLAREVDDHRRGFEALRQSNPGIIIDSDTDALDWRFEQTPPWSDDATPNRGALAREFPEFRALYRSRGGFRLIYSQDSQSTAPTVRSSQEGGEASNE